MQEMHGDEEPRTRLFTAKEKPAMRQLRRKSDLPAPPKGFSALAAEDNYASSTTPKNVPQRRPSQLSAIDDDVSYGFTSDEEEGEIE